MVQIQGYVAIQNDGKILIGGDFLSFNGITAHRIARLNIDGTLDPTFISGIGFDLKVSAIAMQSDGKIIIGGNFTLYNGTSRKRIARLNTDGSLDATFNIGTGANWEVATVFVQDDGKIIVGGDFWSFNGISVAESYASIPTARWTRVLLLGQVQISGFVQ